MAADVVEAQQSGVMREPMTMAMGSSGVHKRI